MTLLMTNITGFFVWAHLVLNFFLFCPTPSSQRRFCSCCGSRRGGFDFYGLEKLQ